MLPARSVQVPTADCATPFSDKMTGAGGLPAANPESTSEQKNAIVTGLLFQPLLLGAGLGVPVMFGGVRSTLTSGDGNVAVFPARSVTLTLPPSRFRFL